MFAGFFWTAVGLILELVPDATWLRHGNQAWSMAKLGCYLHLYCPDKIESSNSDVLVFVHGGHGQAGSIQPVGQSRSPISYAHLGSRYASNGFTTALIGYPLCKTPDHVVTAIWRSTLTCILFVMWLAALIARCLIHVSDWRFSLLFWLIVLLTATPIALLICDRWVDRVAPTKAQTSGTTFEDQVKAVRAGIDLLIMHLGPTRQLVLMGHSHGALLATHVLGQHKTPSVRCFIGVGGVYDPAVLLEHWPRWTRWALRQIYLQPVFGAAVAEKLDAFSVQHMTPKQPMQVVLIRGRGESSARLEQDYAFLRYLKDAGHLSAIMTDPIGFGHGLSLLCAEETSALIRAAIGWRK